MKDAGYLMRLATVCMHLFNHLNQSLISHLSLTHLPLVLSIIAASGNRQNKTHESDGILRRMFLDELESHRLPLAKMAIAFLESQPPSELLSKPV